MPAVMNTNGNRPVERGEQKFFGNGPQASGQERENGEWPVTATCGEEEGGGRGVAGVFGSAGFCEGRWRRRRSGDEGVAPVPGTRGRRNRAVEDRARQQGPQCNDDSPAKFHGVLSGWEIGGSQGREDQPAALAFAAKERFSI